MEQKKKNVSLRMSPNDIERIKHIADRLGVKESDVLRFAVKQMLTRLAPFQEDSYCGIDLMPALLDVGQDMVRFFELGVERLDRIVNRGVDSEDRRIEEDDLKLLALSSVNGKYARLKLNSDVCAQVTDEDSFKEYFLDKYFSESHLRQASDTTPEKKGREWNPVIAHPGSALSMSHELKSTLHKERKSA